MIGKLQGVLSEIDGDCGYIEIGGISFRVFLPSSYLSKKGEKITIYTYQYIRDDEMTLFGFETKKHYYVFLYLINVDGVGPRLAFKIINFLSLDTIYKAVSNKNIHTFQNVPGVGYKTAQKILLELSGKLGEDVDISKITLTPEDKLVIDALKSLGFAISDISKIIDNLNPKFTIEEKVRQAIQMLTKQ